MESVIVQSDIKKWFQSNKFCFLDFNSLLEQVCVRIWIFVCVFLLIESLCCCVFSLIVLSCLLSPQLCPFVFKLSCVPCSSSDPYWVVSYLPCLVSLCLSSSFYSCLSFWLYFSPVLHGLCTLRTFIKIIIFTTTWIDRLILTIY